MKKNNKRHDLTEAMAHMHVYSLKVEKQTQNKAVTEVKGHFRPGAPNFPHNVTK